MVAFDWCHDEELRGAIMFNTTFDVTKEQRNIFLSAGIAGNDKVLPHLDASYFQKRYVRTTGH